jgi:beta-phosphoglucomutase-like phosphatase (HAD superfamily)
MKAAIYHLMKADHTKYNSVQDYINAFNEGDDTLYKSIHFQTLSTDKRSTVENAWNLYQEQRIAELKSIEAAQREEEREYSKPYPSITEVLAKIKENPELIPHFLSLLELDSTVYEYRDNIRKAIWYYKNNR